MQHYPLSSLKQIKSLQNRLILSFLLKKPQIDISMSISVSVSVSNDRMIHIRRLTGSCQIRSGVADKSVFQVRITSDETTLVVGRGQAFEVPLRVVQGSSESRTAIPNLTEFAENVFSFVGTSVKRGVTFCQISGGRGS